VSSLLGIYLNDHLAGATAGRDLARRAQSSNSGSELGDLLGEITTMLDRERGVLLDALAATGVRADRPKQVAAQLAERVGRLKPNGRLRSYSPLSRVVELDALALVLHAAAAFWRSIERTAAADPRLAELDPAGRAADADGFRDRLERHRLEAAAEALRQ
jgi:hypothetical protein